jgi:hypothetical protein
VVWRGVVWCGPAGQPLQSLPAASLVALLQYPASQGRPALLPSGQKFPAKHATQAVVFATDWKVPEAQAVHVAAKGEAEALPAEQAEGATLPVEQALPGWQGEQPD